MVLTPQNQAQSLVFETKDAKLPYERIDLLTYLASLVFFGFLNLRSRNCDLDENDA